ncbi:fibronectin type III domain-containing protein [Sphingobacterium sp. UT-1RO-CII-1]|uniref:fibronectin type III domain-containing protein n=1 Tax=Sphingobacterium sp. UT-1RO-CII-1 TaxID=2995225 RepID=UPI00227B07B9|nr:fibronectin type III domain-containing protein [Sphingobacterium sp. UT-1RO-CII-1]MCY4780776.1 fibronectin type III domain-containing protein [Sphingobacterium sp. UT-1RO-CII-1]
MRVKKVVLDYSGLSDDELNTLVGKVLDCMTGHATFTALPLELEDFEAEVMDFRTKWQKASRGGSLLEIAEKNDAKDVLALSLKDLAFYVNKVSKGSRSLLLSSGLILEVEPKPSDVPDQVLDAKLLDGRQKGQMQVKYKPVRNALLYEYQVTNILGEDNQPVWQETFQASSSRGNIYAVTEPDQIYYLRVRARNKRGIGDWSQVASLRAR